MPHDASATYRGYRMQALYVLARVLTDVNADEQIYRPEGAEDLAVYTSTQKLIEVVQVKDHRSPLSLSDFRPSSADGFFARLQTRRIQQPGCVNRIASFGPIGQELSDAIDGHSPYRAAVINKLTAGNRSISRDDAVSLLDSIRGNITHPNEQELREVVLATLSATIAGAHAESAMELLLFWIFEASERRRDLTRSMLLQQLERIGAYLAALRDSSAEWMTTIRPVRTVALTTEERERLVQEYRQGAQATWAHIVAAADTPRIERLAEIHRKLQAHSVVIIRGASGQGKSSLGWRYLHDYSVDGLRFHVRIVAGREHALRVANALCTHVQQLRLRALVYLDLSPADSGWTELLRELAEAGLKVLVAVREEDFRRAGMAAGDIDVAEMSLDKMSREEAEQIFIGLAAAHPESNVLDFSDAWARFSTTEGGPLLEFAFIVTHGDTLAERLSAQILRIQAEAASASGLITSAQIRLLALAAVANAADCRVHFEKLCEVAEVDPLTRPLAYFEDEYLIRVQQDDKHTVVAPLHALRSQAILAALLHDSPAMWGDLAAQCLSLLLDDDVERFLLWGFSRYAEHTLTLEAALEGERLRSFAQAGGICRALLWQGVNLYERENRNAIVGAIAKYDTGWWFVCDSFIATGKEAGDKLRDTLSELLPDVPRVELTPKERVFAPFEKWASAITDHIKLSARSLDWLGAGDLAFWIGDRRLGGLLRSSMEAVLPAAFFPDLTIDDIAAFVSGRHALTDHAFAEWHENHTAEITRLYLRETASTYLKDDGKEVKVFFPILLKEPANDSPKENRWHTEALRRLHLLRQLFPNREIYSSQGLGFEALADLLPYDETQKRIPAENLYAHRAVELNALFGNLVQYRHQRAASWRTYAESAVAFREGVSAAFRQLHRTWERMLQEQPVQARVIRQMPSEALERIKVLSKLPMLPRSAVDEWGFVSEGRQEGLSATNQNRPLWDGLQRFRGWQKALRDFEMGVTQVSRRAIEATVVHVTAEKTKNSDTPDDNSGHLMLVNLESAWRALASMHREFRELFAHLFAEDRVNDLEQHERSTFRHLWAVAFAFIREPTQRLSGGVASLERSIAQRRTSFLAALVEEISAIVGNTNSVDVRDRAYVVDGEACLLIACDHTDIRAMQNDKPRIVEAIWRAAQSGGWQSLEWVPHVVQWPKVLVVHTYRGRALVPAGAKLDSFVLFASEDEFKVGLHHWIDLPITPEVFAAAEIRLWDLPLVRAAMGWQAALFAFAFAATRFYPMLEVISEHEIPEDILSESLRKFSGELTALREDAQERYQDLLTLVRPLGKTTPQINDQPRDWMDALRRISDACLFSVSGDANTTIDPEGFGSWISALPEAFKEVNDFVADLAEHGVNLEQSLAA